MVSLILMITTVQIFKKHIISLFYNISHCIDSTTVSRFFSPLLVITYPCRHVKYSIFGSSNPPLSLINLQLSFTLDLCPIQRNTLNSSPDTPLATLPPILHQWWLHRAKHLRLKEEPLCNSHRKLELWLLKRHDGTRLDDDIGVF